MQTMGTRPGALDLGAVTYLMREHAMGAADIEDVLYRRSGLAGGLRSLMRSWVGLSRDTAEFPDCTSRDCGDQFLNS